VERLETRDCPAAPWLTLDWQPVDGDTVRVTGVVSDESVSSTTVTLTGALSGTITPDATGEFDCEVQSTGTGEFTGTLTDYEGLTDSQSGELTAYNAPPSLTLMYSWGPNRQVTVAGAVTDENPGGLSVTFGGAATGSAVTTSLGGYSATLTASQLGLLTATVTDDAQQTGQASVTLTNAAPQITSFSAMKGMGNLWTFRGTVDDEYEPGLVVELDGLPSLEGRTATVCSDGSFSLMVELAAGEMGEAHAQATDWWGVGSNVATYFI
jgi:hypothetical protein